MSNSTLIKMSDSTVTKYNGNSIPSPKVGNSEKLLNQGGGKVLLDTMKNVPNLVNVQEVGAEIIGDLCQMGGKSFSRTCILSFCFTLHYVEILKVGVPAFRSFLFPNVNLGCPTYVQPPRFQFCRQVDNLIFDYKIP